jgi:hypothetical protein
MVGGTFDLTGGKPSKIIEELFDLQFDKKDNVIKINGGHVSAIHDILKTPIINFDIIFWFPNIPNTIPRFTNIKEKYPKAIVVTSKRNNDEYTFMELIFHALKLKSNLVLEFNASDPKQIKMRLFDPLGNVWFENLKEPLKLKIAN